MEVDFIINLVFMKVFVNNYVKWIKENVFNLRKKNEVY